MRGAPVARARASAAARAHLERPCIAAAFFVSSARFSVSLPSFCGMKIANMSSCNTQRARCAPGQPTHLLNGDIRGQRQLQLALGPLRGKGDGLEQSGARNVRVAGRRGRLVRTLTLSRLPFRSTVTPLGTGMGLLPIRDSLHCTLSAVRLRQPLLKAAARMVVGLWLLLRCCRVSPRARLLQGTTVNASSPPRRQQLGRAERLNVERGGRETRPPHAASPHTWLASPVRNRQNVAENHLNKDNVEGAAAARP